MPETLGPRPKYLQEIEEVLEKTEQPGYVYVDDSCPKPENRVKTTTANVLHNTRRMGRRRFLMILGLSSVAGGALTMHESNKMTHSVQTLVEGQVTTQYPYALPRTTENTFQVNSQRRTARENLLRYHWITTTSANALNFIGFMTMCVGAVAAIADGFVLYAETKYPHKHR